MADISIGVKAVIKKEGKILLIKRSDKYTNLSGDWDIPGGRIKFGEEPEDGLRREVEEETGITDISIKKILDASTVFLEENKHIVRITYLAETKQDYKKISDEHTHIEWILPENISDEHMKDDLMRKVFTSLKQNLY